jgi:predicted nucleotidyltransferase
MRPSVAAKAHREAIYEIVSRHRARNPQIFGSSARGTDREDSDLDIFVEPFPGMTLLDVGAIIDELETLLGVPVDVLTPGGLAPAIRETVLRDLQPL